MRQFPVWLKQQFSPDGVARQVEGLIEGLGLTTVCQSAVCPNLRECWSLRQLTFMILGERCTRSCGFCAVPSGRPGPPAEDEPDRVADAVARLALKHVVITSVARDDLADEGVGQFVRVIAAIRQRTQDVTVETLIPDLHGREELLARVLDEGRPEVFAHNVETVERLTPVVRSRATYRRSLDVLRFAAARRRGLVKSGVMVGLGESAEELRLTFEDLVEAGATHVTIGQYLRPSPAHLPVLEQVSPARFAAYDAMARKAGLAWVKSGPFVRSSYHAIDAIDTVHA